MLSSWPYQDGEIYKGVLSIECDFHHFDAAIIHQNWMWEQEKNHQARGQEAEQNGQEDILLPAHDKGKERPS